MNHYDNQLLTYALLLHDWLNQPGYVSLFFMSLIASTLLPLGSEWLLITMLLAGYDPISTVAIATTGNYLGAVITYLIGVWGGSWLIETVLRVSPEQQERAKSYYRRFGVYSLLFSWLPVVGDPLCLAGGLLRVNFGLFSLLVGFGKFARYAATAIITLSAV
ncbi:MAG: DedA family protein [Desulfuromonadaceae bacterium]|nr:DedA family protein [Desulfuromonadaceae bacterium]MDD2855762.1 DedA family protein [Desulfuromonadaceae bacterium]